MRIHDDYPGSAAFPALARSFGILVLLTILAATSVQADITFPYQLRDVLTFTTLDLVAGEDQFCSDQKSSGESGEFNETITCQVGEGGHYASATATHHSFIQPDNYILDLSFEASASIDGEASFAEGFGAARVFSDFAIDEPMEIRFMANVDVEGDGRSTVLLRENDGPFLLYREISDGASEVIDEPFSLPAGVYEVNLTLGGFGQAFNDYRVIAGGTASLSIEFSSPADVAELDANQWTRAIPRIVPNPVVSETRLLPALGPGAGRGPIAILDLQGRTVRRLASVPSDGIVWDATDDAGRRLPAGIYLVLDSRGRSNKLILLR